MPPVYFGISAFLAKQNRNDVDLLGVALHEAGHAVLGLDRGGLPDYVKATRYGGGVWWSELPASISSIEMGCAGAAVSILANEELGEAHAEDRAFTEAIGDIDNFFCDMTRAFTSRRAKPPSREWCKAEFRRCSMSLAESLRGDPALAARVGSVGFEVYKRAPKNEQIPWDALNELALWTTCPNIAITYGVELAPGQPILNRIIVEGDLQAEEIRALQGAAIPEGLLEDSGGVIPPVEEGEPHFVGSVWRTGDASTVRLLANEFVEKLKAT